jgi:NAD(P)-dependent dehydrogenase (short-subunit alcohol dehydrogenase family)
MTEGVRSLFDLTGRTALVTGASRGIGRAIALGLAEFGADLVVHFAGNTANAEEVAGTIRGIGRRAQTFQADLSESGAGVRLGRAISDAMGDIDIVVFNASIQIRRPLVDIPPEEMAAQVNTDFGSTVELLQVLLPPMAARGWGRVVTIGSVQQVRPNANLVVYAAMKSAQANVALNVARAYAAKGVTSNNIAPGLIDTDRSDDLKADAEAYRRLLDTIPMKDAGRPDDVVGAVLLFCSEAGRYITGVDLLVDGGLHMPA